jgi:hypothetical protein
MCSPYIPLIDKQTNQNKGKVFSCFADSIWHGVLLYKLMESGEKNIQHYIKATGNFHKAVNNLRQGKKGLLCNQKEHKI